MWSKFLWCSEFHYISIPQMYSGMLVTMIRTCRTNPDQSKPCIQNMLHGDHKLVDNKTTQGRVICRRIDSVNMKKTHICNKDSSGTPRMYSGRLATRVRTCHANRDQLLPCIQNMLNDASKLWNNRLMSNYLNIPRAHKSGGESVLTTVQIK